MRVPARIADAEGLPGVGAGSLAGCAGSIFASRRRKMAMQKHPRPPGSIFRAWGWAALGRPAPRVLSAVVGLAVASLAGCGGGDGAEAPGTASTLPTAADVTELPQAAATTPTLADRQAAATAVAAKDPTCTALTPFYWEIGNKTGKLASGQGGLGRGSAKAPTANTLMPVASASKWVYASAVIEQARGALSNDEVNLLSMRAGYTNFDQCSPQATVDACLAEPGSRGGTNGDWRSDQVGQFYYGGGHMQVLAQQRAWGANNAARLTQALRKVSGMPATLSYVNPQLAGGIGTSATGYATFLRHLLDGSLHQTALQLGQHAVCTHANGTDCSNVGFSPINQSHPGSRNDVSDESWHYSLGHWVEDDPKLGDGAFSSPGRFGFYPWIDSSKTWYGVLARYDAANVSNPDATQLPYNTSRLCGRRIRQAWIQPFSAH